jgi:hypothetical protein
MAPVLHPVSRIGSSLLRAGRHRWFHHKICQCVSLRTRTRCAVGHADDDVANGLRRREVLLDVRNCGYVRFLARNC